MIQVGSTMTLEAWDQAYKPNLDWNHAWGTSPANIIVRYLWGITPKTRGFEIAHLSKPAFCRYFKKRSSKSFFEFLNEYRVGYAKKMLRDNPSLHISFIASQSGFPSIQHFNAIFKRLEETTPKQYRKKWTHNRKLV